MDNISPDSEISDLVRKKCAYLSGGRTTSGSYIISFPEVCTSANSSSIVEDKDYATLFKYLCKAAKTENPDAKFSLVIDRRLNKWANIKSLFSTLQECVMEYESVERVYLLQPSGLFNSLSKLFLFSVDDSKDHNKQQVIFVSLEELHKQINPSQLTSDFAGSLEFDPDEWVNDKKMVETLVEFKRSLENKLTKFKSQRRSNPFKSSPSSSPSRSSPSHSPSSPTSTSLLTTVSTLNKLIVEAEVKLETLKTLCDECAVCISNSIADLTYLNQNSAPYKSGHMKIVASVQKSLYSTKIEIDDILAESKSYQDNLKNIKSLYKQLIDVDKSISKLNNEMETIWTEEGEEFMNVHQLISSGNIDSPKVLMKLHMMLSKMKSTEEDTKISLLKFEDISKDIKLFECQGTLTEEHSVIMQDVVACCKRDQQFYCSKYQILQQQLKNRIQILIQNQHFLSTLNKAVELGKEGTELMKYKSFLLDEDDKSIEDIAMVVNTLKNFSNSSLVEIDLMMDKFDQLYQSSDRDDILLKTMNAMKEDAAKWKSSVDGLTEELKLKMNEMIKTKREMEEEEERKKQEEEERKRQEEVKKMFTENSINNNMNHPSNNNTKSNDNEGDKSPCSEDDIKTFKTTTSTTTNNNNNINSSNSTTTTTTNNSQHHDTHSPKTRKLGHAKIVVDSKIIPSMVLNSSQHKQHQQRFSIVQSQARPMGKQISDDTDSQSQQLPHLIDIKRSSVHDMEKYIPSRLKDELMSIQPVIETGTIRRKRSHVIQELIETERAYVSDLKNIIQGYYDQFDNEEMVHLIPEGMMAKRETFFGNIRDIYHFHAEIFLKGLEACDSRPSGVGRCFIDNKERLQLYSEYCQNKIQAEILIEKFGDSNPFFKACQAKLNHPLPLSSYILKPVQRITKYHLLLKELIRMTTQEEELYDLRKAIVAIGDVLRFVNNSMHQLSIIGYNGNLSDLGRLLIVGPLEVTVDKRKDRSPSLKQTYHKRQVFMYDRCLLFCKRKEPGSNNTLPSYIFKSALKTEEVGPLVESPRGGDERKFELWSKNEVWSFMAPSIAEKADWVDEIKKVLFEQMDMMRAASKRLHIDSSTDGGVVIIDPLVCLQSNELDSLLTVDTLNLS